jgi:hypothetical protein
VISERWIRFIIEERNHRRLISMQTTIETIHGREVLDSRGNPTVEVEVSLFDFTF